MRRKEMVEMQVTYCDWCNEKITDNSHILVKTPDGKELDFHDTPKKKCIDKYVKVEKQKNAEEKRMKKLNRTE